MNSNYYHHFDGMCWPLPSEALGGLSWRLRHAPETITDEQKLVLASTVDAYRELIVISDAHRRPIVRALRKASVGKPEVQP